MKFLCVILLVQLFYNSSFCTVFTVVVKSREKQCFFRTMKANEESQSEFQVLSGGGYDADFIVLNPDGQVMYQKERVQYDSHTLKAEKAGDYQICLSNEYSSFVDKVLYFDWDSEEEDDIAFLKNNTPTAITFIESTGTSIHQYLRQVQNSQVQMRNREAKHRMLMDSLHWLVNMYSFAQTVLIVFVGLGQTWILRSFFTDKKSTGQSNKA